jgi:cardiolipin synthase A/B
LQNPLPYPPPEYRGREWSPALPNTFTRFTNPRTHSAGEGTGGTCVTARRRSCGAGIAYRLSMGTSIVRAAVLAATLLLLAGCGADRPINYKIHCDYTVSDPQFAQTMGNLLGPTLENGNSVSTLRNGDQIFPPILSAIRSATRTIDLETFIFWSGTIGTEFTAALCERAKAGVKVHVLIDAFGSKEIDPHFISQMRQAGATIYQYHPLSFDPRSWALFDHRTHRKILVVDGKIGFTGGVGIADPWTGNGADSDHWRDNHYRIEGPVVGQLQAVFADNWLQTTGEVLIGDSYFPKLASAGNEWAQICRSSPQGGSENMQLMMLLSIAAAGKNIRIESSYFVPDKVTRRALIAARQRGVDVQIIVPGPKIDDQVVRHASRAHWEELLKSGIRIYQFQPAMLHCKQLIVDDLWVSIGSSNMDNRSFRHNDEANLNVLDPNFAGEQAAVFEQDKEHSREVTYEQWKNRSMGERFKNGLADLLSWEM